MIRVQTDQGEISVSNAVFTTITGAAATNCFGVKGMAYRSMTDGLVHLLRREAMSKGVNITYHDDNSISIELHIIVENGVNLPAVCRAIMNEVRYNSLTRSFPERAEQLFAKAEKVAEEKYAHLEKLASFPDAE